jgi:ACT domain-containing protein
MEKARAVKQANDAKRLKESLQKIKKVESVLNKQKVSITDACRKVGISVDKYYRIKKSLKS